MIEKEIAEQNKILEMQSGSQLYGTSTPNSDKDYVGIFLPSEDCMYGLKRVDEVELNIKSKNEGRRNTKDAIDKKLYEFRRFIRLAMDCNPNIVEILFVNKENLLFINKYGQKLLDNYEMFIHKGLKQKFTGYAYSQRKKMEIKRENYFGLKHALMYFEEIVSHDIEFGKRLMDMYKNESNAVLDSIPVTLKKDHCSIGDLNFQYSRQIKHVVKAIKERLAKAGNRESLLLKYGFDTKFGSHLVRLMREGIDLLKNGRLEFPLPYAQELLDIKQGNWKMKEVIRYAEDLEKHVESLYEKSSLQHSPNFNKINKFCIDTMKEFLEENEPGGLNEIKNKNG